jgi:hypothetical protein
VIVACRTGVAHDVWLEDTRALITAAQLLEESDRRARRK